MRDFYPIAKCVAPGAERQQRMQRFIGIQISEEREPKSQRKTGQKDHTHKYDFPPVEVALHLEPGRLYPGPYPRNAAFTAGTYVIAPTGFITTGQLAQVIYFGCRGQVRSSYQFAAQR